MYIGKVSALFFCLALTAGAQTQTGWKTGVAKVDITPAESIGMDGDGARVKPSEGIRKNLHVVALTLEDETGAKSVLVTFDLVEIGRDWGKVITDRCQKEFGLARDRIVLNSSHTHSGPVTGYAAPYYLPMTPADVEVQLRYTHKMVDNAVGAVGQAVRNMSPACWNSNRGWRALA
jgi:neutral ceramidase